MAATDGAYWSSAMSGDEVHFDMPDPTAKYWLPLAVAFVIAGIVVGGIVWTSTPPPSQQQEERAETDG